MNRRISCVVALAVVSLAPGLARGDDEAMKIAVKVTTEGAATFDTLSASAMAAYYEEDARLSLVIRSNEGLKTEFHNGRGEIEKAYAKIFEKPETIKSHNDVKAARLLAPDVLTIDGTFDLNTLKPDSPKIPFHQVRVKKGDKWQILSMEVFYVPAK
ncbi:hypothetical protein [Paludisphaera borealis]|uniref:DUF4440 domain-containing protein n=1 Tax=Paludisphaera borealis TaxID=1387353 RepID=A0A1U7CTE4_9BACT|nr:hypothetical protein [Paludisphaera borealis]APW62169.1 hypothetical protein BSF38_03701 [Paludisphaera borealis]